MGFKFNPFTGDFDMVGSVGVSGVVTESQGGTNQTSYAKGDVLYASATNTLAKLGVGTQEQVFAVSSSGVPYWRELIDTANESVLYDDFSGQNGSGFGDTGWGGGNVAASTAGDLTHHGVYTVHTSTSSTGLGRLSRISNSLRLGGGSISAVMIVRIPILSTGTEEFAFRCGIYDTTSTGADAVDGCYFEYDRATNGDYWVIKTSSNSSRTSKVLNGTGGNPTAAVAANTYYALKIVVAADASRVDFYIDGVNVGNITSNIPTGAGRETGEGLSILKSAGTTQRQADIDLWFRKLRFSTPRYTA